MMDVANELKGREGDQRRLLLELFTFPNMQVRVQAAKLTLAVAPVEARKQLQAIADTHWLPQAGDAGMSLSFLDRDVFKPTCRVGGGVQGFDTIKLLKFSVS